MNTIQHRCIPNSIAEYLNVNDGVNLSININHADGLNGYGHIMLCSVSLSRITRTCNRCGYDPLWHSDKDKCIRHTYNNWRYDDVFVWKSMIKEGHIDISSLEKAFNTWLEAQPTQYNQPAKLMIFDENDGGIS